MGHANRPPKFYILNVVKQATKCTACQLGTVVNFPRISRKVIEISLFENNSGSWRFSMCIVVDTNCFSHVMNVSDADHAEFSPVLAWVIDSCGKFVYGGSKYKTELGRATKYLGFFTELKRAGKVIEVNQAEVDTIQARLEHLFGTGTHNDHHLPAIVNVAKCKLVCTEDTHAQELLKEPGCYERSTDRPRIYCGKRNANLLCDKNMAEICMPKLQLPKDQRAELRVGAKRN